MTPDLAAKPGEKPRVFVREATGLVREFGLLEGFLFNFADWNLPVSVIGIAAGVVAFPGADMTTVLLLGLGPILAYTLVLIFLSVGMPRSGGDFWWESICLHPAIGFMVTLAVVFGLFLGVAGYCSWIVNYVMSGGLSTIGILTGNTVLMNWGTLLATPSYTFGIGLLVVFSCIACMMFGPKGEKTALRLSVIPSLVVIVIPLWVLATSTHAQFLTSFNTVNAAFTHSPNSVQVIEALYTKMGGSFPRASVAASVPALIVGFWTLNGSYGSATAIGGEVKSAKKSQTYGILASTFFSLFWLLAFVALYYNVVGWDLGNAIQLAATSPNYPIPVPPTTTYLLGLLIANPWLNIVLLVGMVWGIWGVNLTIMMMVVRYFFSYSFASILPSKFADINERLHCAWVSIIFAAAGTIVMLWLYVYTSVVGIFTNYATMLAIGGVFISLAGVVFPFRKKTIFEAAPKPMSSKIAGIPLVSIISLISLVSLGFVVYTGLNSGTIATNGVIVVALIIALIIFYVAKFYRARHGVDLGLISRELPPE